MGRRDGMQQVTRDLTDIGNEASQRHAADVDIDSVKCREYCATSSYPAGTDGSVTAEREQPSLSPGFHTPAGVGRKVQPLEHEVRVSHQECALPRQTCRRYPEFSYARFRRGDGAVDV